MHQENRLVSGGLRRNTNARMQLCAPVLAEPGP